MAASGSSFVRRYDPARGGWVRGRAGHAPPLRRGGTFWAEKNPSAGLMEGRQGDFGVFCVFFCGGSGFDRWERSERYLAENLYNWELSEALFARKLI